VGKVTNSERSLVVVIAGCRWENIRGTDHRLAIALSAEHDVLWVDPVVPRFGPAEVERPVGVGNHFVDQVAQGISRLRVLAPPGPSRILVRSFCNRLLFGALSRVLREGGNAPVAILSMSPNARLPRNLPGKRILHVTDDWVAGADMMGLSGSFIRRNLMANLRTADAVTAVTPQLAAQLMEMHPTARVGTLPNGCQVVDDAGRGRHRACKPIIALLGQLNERLDLDLLESLAASGVGIRVIGPRRERDPAVKAGLDRFLNHDNVDWHGEVPASEVPELLTDVSAGITPYLVNEFNGASFPLKTLEYLAAGLPVVSTDSSAARWLDSELIRIGRTREEFIGHVRQLISEGVSYSVRAQNQEFARGHTWAARAASIRALFADGAEAGEPDDPGQKSSQKEDKWSIRT